MQAIQQTHTANYRIYVASLADYNEGTLYGKWIDLDGKSAEEITEEVQAMLKASPSDSIAEEWAIHDYDGIECEEWDSFEDIAEKVSILEQLSGDELDAYPLFVANYDVTDLGKFEDAYQGKWASELDYCYDYVDAIGLLSEMPEHLHGYFDYDSYARDLFINDYTFIDGHVFHDYSV
jgi:antirestriction protein